MRTTIGVSKKTKGLLEDVMNRKNLGSFHDAVRYLLVVEKEFELAKLRLPTIDEIGKIMEDTINKARGY